MPTTLVLVHDEHFDLLLPADAPSGEPALGTYTVLNRQGQEEQRDKYRFIEPENTTTVAIPDDFDLDDLTALTHLVQMLRDRHTAAPTGVYGDDPELVASVAALLRVPVLNSPETQQ